MRFIRPFPLLAIPVLVYNVMVYTGALLGGNAQRCAEAAGYPIHPMACQLQAPMLHVPMAATVTTGDGQLARVVWTVSAGDLLLVLSLVVLFAELLKSTTTRRSAITNHALSLVVLLFGLVEFLLMPAFATSSFFLILSMALLDVLAGFIVTIAASRRDVSFGR